MRRAVLGASATCALVLCLFAAVTTHAATLSIAVAGNHFVNGDGQTVRLLGVDEESTEYACYYGYAYANVPLTAGDAAAIASWGADAVRVPLNEDCWLGINGLPADGLTAAGYQQAIEAYVAALNAEGIYAILDLHWSAPGSDQSDGQRPMPDDHSVAFWASVATAFLGNRAVVFDAFNEPYSAAADGWSDYPVSWACWRNGGCSVPDDVDGTTPYANPSTYSAVGMQTLVSAIRATGATQPIMLGGLSYANDLSGWLANEPADPDGQLAASFHNYNGESCDDLACWNVEVAPLAASVPVVTGEFDEDDCPAGGGADPSNFDNTYMNWADAHGVSYLAWGWLVLDGSSPPACSALTLLNDYSGTPADPNGVAVRDHLLALAGGSPTPAGSGSVGGVTTGSGGATASVGATIAQLDSALGRFLRRTRDLSRKTLLRTDRVAAVFNAPMAGTLKLRLAYRGIAVASGSASCGGERNQNVWLELTKAGRRVLEHHRQLRLTVHASYVAQNDADGSAHGKIRVGGG